MLAVEGGSVLLEAQECMEMEISRKTLEQRGIELMTLASSEEGIVEIRMQYMLLAADVEPTVSRLLRASTPKMIEAILDSEFPSDPKPMSC